MCSGEWCHAFSYYWCTVVHLAAAWSYAVVEWFLRSAFWVSLLVFLHTLRTLSSRFQIYQINFFFQFNFLDALKSPGQVRLTKTRESRVHYRRIHWLFFLQICQYDYVHKVNNVTNVKLSPMLKWCQCQNVTNVKMSSMSKCLQYQNVYNVKMSPI